MPQFIQQPQNKCPYSHGDILEFKPDKDGAPVVGKLVSISRDRLKITVATETKQYTGGWWHFTKTDKPFGKPGRTDPQMALSAFSATGYRHGGGHEGNGYTATLRYNGKIVGKMYNDGVGGCGSLTASADTEKLLSQSLKDAWTICGGKPEDSPGVYDLMDIWSYWNGVLQKTGRTFCEEVGKLQQSFDKYKKVE